MTALSPAREAAAVLSDRELSAALGLWHRLRDDDGTLRETVARALPFRIDQLFDGPHEYPTWEERLRTADAAIEALRGAR